MWPIRKNIDFHAFGMVARFNTRAEIGAERFFSVHTYRDRRTFFIIKLAMLSMPSTVPVPLSVLTRIARILQKRRFHYNMDS